MRISRLVLNDFRNYREFVLEPAESLTILSGPNAAGKTNLVEAIEVVTAGRSFRSSQWFDLVKRGAERALVRMTAAGEMPEITVDLTISHNGKRAWKVDGLEQKRTRAATSRVPTVSFTPDDMALVKGSPERRRTAIDFLGDQLSASYAALRKDYARVVRQRNKLLGEGGGQELIESFDEQLAALGARLHTHRRRLLGKVMEVAAPVYERLSGGESLTAGIRDRCGLPSSDEAATLEAHQVSDSIKREIVRRHREERARGISLVGPHRDDIAFAIGGHDARAYASQGQQRTAALAWKWAEVAVIEAVLDRVPVLLLDDVMSELDEARRAALTELMSRDVQTFVTATNMDYFRGYRAGSMRVVPVGSV